MKLSPRAICELIGHEAIVQEAYKDSQGIWTWAVGVTSASSHHIYPRYLDNPQPVQRCLEVSIWLMQNRYLPPVLEAFEGYPLAEHELAAAVSFHYNTGAIKRATWVTHVKAGRTAQARASFMEWIKNPELKKRRTAECDLFFRGIWSKTNGTAFLIPVRKPSYQPNFAAGKRVEIRKMVEQIMGGN